MDELITRGTIDLSLIGYFASLLLLTKAKHSSQAMLNWARRAWSAGALLLLLHVVCAFQFYHDWSHSAAVADTARQTKNTVGFAFGAGVWVNYLFSVVWLADVLWWWRAGHDSYRRRSTWWSWGIHGFLLFVVINGTVVFESGVVRWLSLLAIVVIIWSKKCP